MKARITKRLVDGLQPPGRGERVMVYDDLISGFGLSAAASGRKAFFIEYGPKGKRHRLVLGPYGVLTPDQARALAREKLALVVQGGDPLAERRARSTMPTFAEWVGSYLEDVARRKKSLREDRRYLDLACRRWGSRPLDAITAEDIRQSMAAMSEAHPVRGNRWLASVRACLSAAWRAGVIDSNPAMRIRLNRESEPRARTLSDEEFRRLVAAIDELEDPFARAGLLLLVLTGARLSEVLWARWADVDLAGATWRIPSPKSGRPQVLPLSPETVGLLRSLPRLGNWVLPGRKAGCHRTDLKRPWASVVARANLADVHIHDLRRTFGLTVARSAGLHAASKLLRHSDVRVTERVYAPLGLDDLRGALDKASAARGEVVPREKQA